jgi:hypothetical protein
MSMSKKGPRRHYDRLTPEERFKLDVLAMARDDAAESERLTNTCPRRNYIMNDWGFVGRWEAARELAMLAYIDFRKCLDKIQMIEAFRVTLPYFSTVWENDTFFAYFDGHEAGSRHAWAKAAKEGDPPGYEEDEDERVAGMDPATEEDLRKWAAKVAEVERPITRALDRVEREMTCEGLSVWKAFVGFCEEEMALAASELLSALALEIAEKARTLEELAARLEVEPDAEDVERYREILGQAWRKVLAKDA